MQKNVNFMLLTIIILVVMILAGISVYYQSTYTNISSMFSQKVDELEKTRLELENKQNVLSKTSEELGLKEERVDEFNKLYENVTDQKDYYEKRSQLVEEELNRTRKEKDQYYKEWQATSANLATTKTTLDSTTKELESAKSAIKSYKNIISDLSDSINSLLSSISSAESDGANSACLPALGTIRNRAEDTEGFVKDLRKV